MTAKDMNFTMDRQRMEAVQQLMQQAQQPQQTAQAQSPAPQAATKVKQGAVAKNGVPANKPSAAPKSTPVPTARSSGGLSLLWPMLNSAALVAVAAWFYWQGEQNTASSAVVDATPPQVQSLELTALKETVATLQAELNSQRELADQLQAELVDVRAAFSATQQLAKTQPPKAQPTWVINAGDYRDQQRASAAASSLRLLGYQVELTQAAGVWQLRLPGFDKRAQAEEAARQIMAGSELNGLWVSRLPAS